MASATQGFPSASWRVPNLYWSAAVIFVVGGAVVVFVVVIDVVVRLAVVMHYLVPNDLSNGVIRPSIVLDAPPLQYSCMQAYNCATVHV